MHDISCNEDVCCPLSVEHRRNSEVSYLCKMAAFIHPATWHNMPKGIVIVSAFNNSNFIISCINFCGEKMLTYDQYPRWRICHCLLSPIYCSICLQPPSLFGRCVLNRQPEGGPEVMTRDHRPHMSPGCEWENDIKMDCEEIGLEVVGLIYVAQNFISRKLIWTQ